MNAENTASETTAPASTELTLKEKITVAALESTEAHVFMALEDIKKLGKILVEDSANPFDNVAYNGILLFEAQLKAAIDKIDGQVG